MVVHFLKNSKNTEFSESLDRMRMYLMIVTQTYLKKKQNIQAPSIYPAQISFFKSKYIVFMGSLSPHEIIIYHIYLPNTHFLFYYALFINAFYSEEKKLSCNSSMSPSRGCLEMISIYFYYS